MNFCENFDLLRIERFVVHEKRRKNEIKKEKKRKKTEIRIKKEKRKLAQAIQTKVC
jgi:type III secretory pathway component EscU